MYAIRSYYGTNLAVDALNLVLRLAGAISGKGARITSYNVCYTKLLRFGWRTAGLIALVFGVLTFAPLIIHYLGKHGMEGAARVVSWVGYTWAGLLFFFFWTNLAVDALNLSYNFV